MIAMNHKLIASGINDKVQIFLDRWDYETYSVSIHPASGETTHEDFDSITEATLRFFQSCKEYGVEYKKAT